MGMVDHESRIQLAYAPQDVYKALKECVTKLDGFQLDSVDDRMLIVHIKAGMSLFSWGENITATIYPRADGASEVSVLSAPKTGIMFGGAMDMGKNRRNINTILTSLSEALSAYKPVSLLSANNDIADQIRKLADLRDAGILPHDEFDAKKNQLLNS